MNSKILILSLIAAASLSQIKAQGTASIQPVRTEPVKIELPPDPVIKYFRSRVSSTAEVNWTKRENAKDVYIVGDYTVDGDKKQVVFRNNAYFCTQTQVPLEYCPAKIKTALDTLAPGFKLAELYFENTNRQKGYRAVVQKGKRKKAQYRDLMFSLKGDFMMESDVNKIIRGF